MIYDLSQKYHTFKGMQFPIVNFQGMQLPIVNFSTIPYVRTWVSPFHRTVTRSMNPDALSDNLGIENHPKNPEIFR